MMTATVLFSFNININLQNGTINSKNQAITGSSQTHRETSKQENRGEDRQVANRNLRDLIQILLIRELVRRRRRPPMPGRPTFPGGGRPPFPGGPGQGRPPIIPRDFNNLDMYEQY